MTLPALMKAARLTHYGGPDAVVIEDRPLPQPAAGEVLVQVRAAPVTAGDARMRSGKVPRGFGLLLRLAMGWSRPRNPPGWAFAGVDPASGQRVFGIAGIRGGAHAEYVSVKTAQVMPLPEDLSFEEGAAFFFGGLTAAEYLIDKCKLQAGERVLINGATGAVGSAALQIARHIGAEVTAVASLGNHALARQLGAAAVIDYRSQPVSGRYDVVLDVIGTLAAPRSHLAPGGRLGLISGDLPATLGALLERGVFAGPSGEGPDKMQRLIALFHAGAYRPVLGQVLPFAQLAEAHALAETFHKPGNLVVAM